jgi:hypothetical protein
MGINKMVWLEVSNARAVPGSERVVEGDSSSGQRKAFSRGTGSAAATRRAKSLRLLEERNVERCSDVVKEDSPDLEGRQDR